MTYFRRVFGAFAIPLLVVGCGGAGPAADDAPDAAPVTPPDPATCDQPVGTAGRITYYVAANQPGADNVACDGRAPTDEGGGRCPFRDFTSLRVREVLYRDADGTLGVRAVTVVVREGVYTIEPLDGFPGEPLVPLWISGAGTRAEDVVVLAGYPGERAVLDGSCDDAVPECSSPEDPGRISTMLNVWGSWVRVEGLTFQGAHKWNITVGGRDVCLQDNELIGPHGSDSDSIKSFNDSGPGVVIRRNDFHDFAEQFIDATAATGWLITDNDFRGAGTGVGFKYAARGAIVRANRFRDIAEDGLSLGGTSSDHQDEFEAFGLVAEGNYFADIGERAIQVVYCDGCTIRDNLIERAAVGILAPDQGPSGCPGGCTPTRGLVIERNVMRDITGNSDAPPDVFVGLDRAVTGAITAGANLYCVGEGGTASFWRGGSELLGFDAWVAEVGTDATSRVEPRSSADCAMAWPRADLPGR